MPYETHLLPDIPHLLPSSPKVADSDLLDLLRSASLFSTPTQTMSKTRQRIFHLDRTRRRRNDAFHLVHDLSIARLVVEDCCGVYVLYMGLHQHSRVARLPASLALWYSNDRAFPATYQTSRR